MDSTATPEALPTRLILTNLPPSLTLPLLRTHLSRCPPYAPQLTDLKILLKPDGSSRRIAFAGFKESKEAKRVKEWTDGTWLQGVGGGSSIRVDWAKEAKDAPPPRKRVKHSGTEPSDSPSSPSAFPPTPASNKDEATRFAEFMSVMGPRKGRALEDLPQTPDPVVVPVPVKVVEKVEVVIPKKVEEKIVEPVVEQEIVKDAVVDDENISDMEYMARRTKRLLEVEPEVDQDIEEDLAEDGETGTKQFTQDEDDAPAKTEESQAAFEVPADTDKEATLALITDSSRLFIRNLAFTISEEDLRELLEPFGELEQIHIPLDSTTKTGKGLAYATFTASSSAIAAYEELDRRSFQGRLLHVIPAIARNSDVGRDINRRDEGVKGQRDELKKKDAGKGINWGTLYMNSDAVMSSVADRLKISKSELLDPSSDNAAVRVALAESHVIAETKKYFEEEGVNLEAFNKPGPRSNTTMLLKNIPYATSSATLGALFAPFGTISRLLLPPAGTIAIVEMTDAPSASDAWRGLVYKKIGGSVLYLEKAPASLFSGPPLSRPTFSSTAPLNPVASSSTSNTKAIVSEDETVTEAAATLFVKNLNFTTTTAILTSTFSQFPNFLFARVQTKPDSKRPGQTLSMGFGFVGFKTIEGATEAKGAREGFMLEGHQLEIKFAQRGKEKEAGEEKKGEKRGTSTKIIVKNVPFEVTRKDIRELFSAYGKLKSVRLPRKMDHKTRGFAFLDFQSRRDAEAAFDALEHTHLLGRHLVLQWAETEGEAVEQLRKRVGGFSDKKIGNKKGKFMMGGEKGAPDAMEMGEDMGGD